MFSFVLLLCIPVVTAIDGFVVPNAEVIAFAPRGFQVSIPHQDGMKLFAFHGKINEEFEGREAGTFAVDIIKPRNGRWTYNNKQAKLKPGDILYYWTYVDYDDGERKLGYPKDDQKFDVKELVPRDQYVTSTTSKPETGGDGGSCGQTATQVRGRKVCQNELLLEENFDNWNFNLWAPELKFATAPDYEFVLYGNDPQVTRIQNGHLLIQPLLTDDRYGKGFVTLPGGLDLGDKCTGVPGTMECSQKPAAWLILPPVLSGKLNTKKNFSFVYGKVQIRAKLPAGDWIYPELFLNSLSEEYGPLYESGQIRVAFMPGNRNTDVELSGGCILGDTDAARFYGLRKTHRQQDLTEDFHVYEVKWTPDGISVSVDGENYGNIYPPQGGFAQQGINLGVKAECLERWRTGSKIAPFDKEMYLVLGVGVGGQCFPDSNEKPWINHDPKNQRSFYKAKSQWHSTWGNHSALLVDYVKVYAL